ncbi:MAG: MarR family transcriptional regulator [Planctomycetota bacterium]|nr:MAG: MarR family transcriptional regulator [Planctomycetota bacterium]
MNPSAPTRESSKAEKPKRTKATAGRFAVLNAFVDFTLGGLSRNDLAVWLILWRDERKGTSRTSQSDLARRAGVTRRTVVRVLDRLETKGLLQRVRRGGLNRGLSVYRVLPLSKPP